MFKGLGLSDDGLKEAVSIAGAAAGTQIVYAKFYGLLEAKIREEVRLLARPDTPQSRNSSRLSRAGPSGAEHLPRPPSSARSASRSNSRLSMTSVTTPRSQYSRPMSARSFLNTKDQTLMGGDVSESWKDNIKDKYYMLHSVFCRLDNQNKGLLPRKTVDDTLKKVGLALSPSAVEEACQHASEPSGMVDYVLLAQCLYGIDKSAVRAALREQNLATIREEYVVNSNSQVDDRSSSRSSSRAGQHPRSGVERAWRQLSSIPLGVFHAAWQSVADSEGRVKKDAWEAMMLRFGLTHSSLRQTLWQALTSHESDLLSFDTWQHYYTQHHHLLANDTTNTHAPAHAQSKKVMMRMMMMQSKEKDSQSSSQASLSRPQSGRGPTERPLSARPWALVSDAEDERDATAVQVRSVLARFTAALQAQDPQATGLVDAAGFQAAFVLCAQPLHLSTTPGELQLLWQSLPKVDQHQQWLAYLPWIASLYEVGAQLPPWLQPGSSRSSVGDPLTWREGPGAIRAPPSHAHMLFLPKVFAAGQPGIVNDNIPIQQWRGGGGGTESRSGCETPVPRQKALYPEGMPNQIANPWHSSAYARAISANPRLGRAGVGAAKGSQAAHGGAAGGAAGGIYGMKSAETENMEDVLKNSFMAQFLEAQKAKEELQRHHRRRLPYHTATSRARLEAGKKALKERMEDRLQQQSRPSSRSGMGSGSGGGKATPRMEAQERRYLPKPPTPRSGGMDSSSGGGQPFKLKRFQTASPRIDNQW